MIALVRGVIAASTSSGIHAEVVRADVDEHRPRARPGGWRSTVALKVKLTVTTSSPGPMPSAAQQRLERDGAVGHEDGVPDAAVGGPRLPRTRSSAGPSRACRSGGRRGRPRSSSGPMSGFEIGITRAAFTRGAHAAVRRRSGSRGRRPVHAAVARRVRGERHARRVDEALAAGADPADAGARGCRRRARGPARRASRRRRRRRSRTGRRRCRRRRPRRRRSRRRSARRIGLTVQSSARARRPSAVIARGNRSLVRIAFGPMNTPSSTVTPW